MNDMAEARPLCTLFRPDLPVSAKLLYAILPTILFAHPAHIRVPRSPHRPQSRARTKRRIIDGMSAFLTAPISHNMYYCFEFGFLETNYASFL